jgi:glutamyl/glutaminyl-tRNA synthetase
MLVRFDDTNPSKEKEEYEENIVKDLETLNVHPHAVSHSSDHFATLEKLALQLIKGGKAYMDDTDQATMQEERMERKESKNREQSIEDSIRLFDLLIKGDEATKTYCLRAKIDMASVNGCMRDPVFYRSNDIPHHRTGTKHKAYPTYDFACPCIDSIEGVTHCLRTTEYNDRDEQYHWVQSTLALPKRTTILAFGKMNFVHTVLSKRKLNWFVENKHVDGWFDPRFPTIQGCVRRGMSIESLKSFIINLGASRRVITMEWDKFWSDNKKIMEESAARYMGVNDTDKVELTIDNVEDVITAHSVQIHPQKPEMGFRVMRRYKKIFVDQTDAATYKEGEAVTFLRWGNINIHKIVRAENGKVMSMTGTYDATATNFSKTKKATWIAAIPDLVPCTVVEFDHLITKAKLSDDEDFKDFLNPVTRMESSALCDPCLRGVNAGDIIQLERKGFYRCDQAYGGVDKPCVLFFVPDGKLKPAPVVAPKKK